MCASLDFMYANCDQLALVGQNVGQTAGSFGAGLQNVPPPISTQLPSTRPSTALVRQPQGQRLQSLPPISDLLGVGVPSILPTTLLPRPDTPVFQSSPLPFGTYTVAGVRVPIFGQNQNLFGQHQNLNTMVEKVSVHSLRIMLLLTKRSSINHAARPIRITCELTKLVLVMASPVWDL